MNKPKQPISKRVQDLKEKLSRAVRAMDRRSLGQLVGGLLFVVLLWWVLRSLISSAALAAEWKLALLMLTALLCLLVGLVGLGVYLRSRGRPQTTTLPLSIVLGFAYLVPALTFLLPGWLNISRLTPVIPGSQPIETFQTAPGQPWFFIWQALVLAGYGISQYGLRFWRRAAQPQTTSLKKTAPLSLPTPTAWQIISGLLIGLGLVLCTSFFVTLLSPGTLENPPFLLPTLRAATLLIAVLFAPWAEETFFRGELLTRWQGKLGIRGAVLATSALFALLQVRPLLWLPAFVVSVTLSELTRRTGHLLPAVLAHAAYNLLIFAFGWHLVI